MSVTCLLFPQLVPSRRIGRTDAKGHKWSLVLVCSGD